MRSDRTLRWMKSYNGAVKFRPHPCILNMVYSREVERSISQDGEGESERTLEAKSLKRRLDPLTIFHKDRTVSEASPAPF
jgi:hypothetical protein